MNATNLEEDKKPHTHLTPVYATLNGSSSAQHTVLPHSHARNGTTHPQGVAAAAAAAAAGGSGYGANAGPQYSRVADLGQGHRELDSSVVYYELMPTRTEEVREPQDYALPVATLSPLQSQPYEVPISSLAAHINNKVRT